MVLTLRVRFEIPRPLVRPAGRQLEAGGVRTSSSSSPSSSSSLYQSGQRSNEINKRIKQTNQILFSGTLSLRECRAIEMKFELCKLIMNEKGQTTL